MSLTTKLDGIQQKVKEMALKLERLKSENAVLKEENQHLREQLQQVDDRPQASQSAQNKRLKKTHLEEGNSDQLKQTLDQYIQEIDKCIEWLNNY
ncbi:MAG: hypothetical protein AAFO07_03905 [Bacteroidota bacterium]